MEGDEFLNKTKRLQWYNNGLHHHARIYILSSPQDQDEVEAFFDLSKGPTNKPDIEQRPLNFQFAHEYVKNLLNSQNLCNEYQFCSFLYVGYDVVQGG